MCVCHATWQPVPLACPWLFSPCRRELGADEVHNWRDAAALLPKLYGPQPFDVVFDVVGGGQACFHGLAVEGAGSLQREL